MKNKKARSRKQEIGRIFLLLPIIFHLSLIILPGVLQSEQSTSQAEGRGGGTGSAGGLRVEVLPNPAIAEPGTGLKLELRVSDFLGAPVEAKARWMVIPRSLGRIEDGVFQAGDTPGKGIIRVTVDSGKAQGVGHTLIRVERGGKMRRITVSLSPEEALIYPGGSQKFEVRTGTQEGRPLQGVVTWQVLPEGLGRVTREGLFLAGERVGEGKVVAKVRTEEGTGVGYAPIRVSSLQDSASGELVLRPSFVLLKPGEIQRFEVEFLKKPALGSPAPPSILWKVEPEGFGTITEEGVFHAGEKEGRGVVEVQLEAGDLVVSAQASVFVGRGERLIVKIHPKEIFLAPAEIRQIEVSVTRPDGTPVEADLQWQVVPERLGFLTYEGSFTAGFEILTGQVAVYAKSGLGEGLDIARVLIRPRRFQVEILPSSTTLRPEGTKEFQVEVWDEGNHLVQLEGSILLWSMEPPEIGTINQDLIFKAGSKPMAGRVIARVPPEMGVGEGFSLVTIQSIIKKKREKFDVEILPSEVTLRPYQSTDFTVKVDGDWIQNSEVFWFVSPPELGTITQNGIFTAKMPSSGGEMIGTVTAQIPPELGVGKGYAQVHIIPIIRRRERFEVRVFPSSAILRPYQQQQFDAVVEPDPSGGIFQDPIILWSVEPPNLGEITDYGLFRAAMPSQGEVTTGNVIARINPEIGVGEGRAHVTITPVIRRRPPYKLVLQPQNPVVKVNRTLQFTAYVLDFQGQEVNATFEWGVEGDIGTIEGYTIAETVIFLAGPVPGTGSVFVNAHLIDPTHPKSEISLRASTHVTVVE
ncbi:hypothetical protein IIA15_02065 [candidate division TA06 bacterium]|nr:hypothetical protein [candidate division TA06 bacterium]